MTDSENIVWIKNSLKSDYKFIQHDGMILTIFAKNLYENNDKNLTNAIQYLEGLSKKQILDAFEKIVNDLETSKEIESVIQNNIENKRKILEEIQCQISTSKEKSRLLQSQCKEKEKCILKLEKEFNFLSTQLKSSFEEKQNLLEQEFQEKSTSFEEKQNLLEQEFQEKSTTLIQINNALETIYFSDDFKYEKCDYVCCYNVDTFNLKNTNHIYFLDTKKYCPLTLTGDRDPYLREYSIKLNFAINIKLMEDECIISTFYFQNVNSPSVDVESESFLIYLSNYGRLIISEKVKFMLTFGQYYYNNGRSSFFKNFNLLTSDVLKEPEFIYTREFISQKNPYDYDQTPKKILQIKKSTPEDFPLTVASKLLYKLPTLFFKVINAFYKHNTDAMQECCKEYFYITRKDKEKETTEFLKIISEKDVHLNKKEKEIEEKELEIHLLKKEIEKMKLENTKLKSALQQFFE